MGTAYTNWQKKQHPEWFDEYEDDVREFSIEQVRIISSLMNSESSYQEEDFYDRNSKGYNQ